MAEALRETFQGRLTYFRTDAIEIGNRAAFEERGQSYNFDLRGSGTVMPTVPIATLPYRGKRKPERRKAALVKSTPARTWHDRMDEA